MTTNCSGASQSCKMAAPPQALANVLTNRKTRVGAIGGWFVTPVRRWYQDFKGPLSVPM
jgi:hypothetical protein